jgi:hypothetical protein
MNLLQSNPFHPHLSRSIPSARSVACLASVFLGCVAGALAQSGTTTTLSVTSGGAPAIVVRQGDLVTLSATVTAANGSTVSPGQVEFCEVAAPPLRCSDIRLLATKQLSSTGVASYKFYPGPGTHAYQAMFLGTHLQAAGSSTSTVLTVTPFYTTTTALSSGPATSGGYTLTATVTGSQGSLPPTGTVTFEDASNGNYVLGTATLVPGTTTAPTGLSFATSQIIPTTGICLSALVADVNGDGKPDLVVGLAAYNDFGEWGDTIEVFLGNGDGTFTKMPAIPVLLSTIALAVGDFNGDGKPDLVAFGVTPAYGSPGVRANQAQVLLGNGDGTFSLGSVLANPDPNQAYPGLSPPGAPPYPNMANPTVAVGDFNGDGIADIVFTTGVNQTLAVFFGKGDGTFQAGPITPAGFDPNGIAVGDFNGDGKADLAITNTITTAPASTITILLGNGDGTFTAAPAVPVDTQSAAIVTGDFDGDGILDLAAESYESPGEVNIFLGSGNGTFTRAAQGMFTGTAASGSVLAVGDFNGDGKADLITASPNSQLSVLLGNGDATFQPAISVAVPNPLALPNPPDAVVSGVALGDFVGSGLSGIASAVYASYDASVFVPQASPQTSQAMLSGVSIVGTGQHDIVAVYSGSSIYQTSTSPPLLISAEQQPTSVTLTVSPTSTNYGQPVLMTATITPTAAQGHNATGTVTFQVASKTLGTVPLVNGGATFTSSLLPVGTDTVAAIYSGDPYFATGGGSATEVVTGFNSVSVLTPTPNPSYVGQAVTLTAAVTGVGSAVVPAGTVTFYDSATVIGQATLDAAGHAAITTRTLSLGIHTLSFVYTGDLGFYASTSPAVLQLVTAQGSTTTLAVSPNPAGTGQQVTMTAGVTLSDSTAAGGTITFYDGATQIDQTTLDPTGHASYATAGLTVGTHSLSAVYTGNANYGASTSPTVIEVIEAAGFTIALSSPNVTLQTYRHTTTAATLTSLGNFADNVAVVCGNLPAYVTCIFTPSTAALPSNGTAAVSLYLDTSSILGADNATSPLRPPGQSAALATLAVLLFPFGIYAIQRRKLLASGLLLAILSTATVFALTSCGGNIITPFNSAAPGTYTIPITATGVSTGIAHTVTLTLTVTP